MRFPLQMNAGRIQKKDISIHVNQKPAQDLKACLEFSSGYFLQGGYNLTIACLLTPLLRYVLN